MENYARKVTLLLNMEAHILRDILRVGIKAASPYNGQPWGFQLKDSGLLIFAKDAKGGFLENFENLPFYSLGPLLENLSEGAAHWHYAMSYRLNDKDGLLGKALCEVTFTPTGNTAAHDITHVLARYTNRKLHHTKAVPEHIRAKIRDIFQGPTREALDITQNQVVIDNLASLESMRIDNSELFGEIIDNVCFTPEDAEKLRRGLDLRTLEIPTISAQFLRANRNPIFRRLMRGNFIAKAIAKQSHLKLLNGTGLLIAFKETNNASDVLVKDWMDIQKITNFLQKEGLSSHLVASSVDIVKITRTFFEPAQQSDIALHEKNIHDAIGMKPEFILTLLRVGYADECAIKSLRMNPEDLMIP